MRVVLVLEAPSSSDPTRAMTSASQRTRAVGRLGLRRSRRDSDKFPESIHQRRRARLQHSIWLASPRTHSFDNARIAWSTNSLILFLELAAAPRGQQPHQRRQHVAREPCTRVLTSAKCIQSPPRPHIYSCLEAARKPSPRSAARRFPLLRDPWRRLTTKTFPAAIAARPRGTGAHGTEIEGRAMAGVQRRRRRKH